MTSPMRKSSRVTKRKVFNDYEYDLTRKKTTSPPESHLVTRQITQSKIENKKSCDPSVKKTSILNSKQSNQRKKQTCNENGNGKGAKEYVQNSSFTSSERKSLQKNSHANLSEVSEQSFTNQPQGGSRFNLGQEVNTSVSTRYICHKTEDLLPGNVCSSSTQHSDRHMEEVTIETQNSGGTAKGLSPCKKLLVAQLQLSPVVPTQRQIESQSKESPNALESCISKSSYTPQNALGPLTKNRKSKIIGQFSCESDIDPSDSSGDENKPVKNSGKYFQSKKYRKKIRILPKQKEHSKMKWTHTSEGWGCSYCGKHFKSLKLVSFHEKSHAGVKPFSCSYCGQKFGLKSNMQHHEQLHSEDKPYMCEVCGKCFKTSAYCKSHGQIHLTGKLFKCDSPNCRKSFSTRRYYHIHQLCHRNVKPFKCNNCGKLFRRRSDLNIHSSIHSLTKLFRCDVCQKRFSHKYALKAHSVLHRKRPFNCAYCQRFFATEADKNIHEAFHFGHPSFECEVCHLENIGLRQLGTHLRKVHGVETANIKCLSCHLTFPTEFIYEKHCSSKTILSCPCCDKVLVSTCEMFIHRKEHQGKESGLIVKICNVCNFCGKEFRRLSSLTKHKLIHETGKLTCKICGKETMNKHNLKVHIETHSKEKSFSCVTCGKCFSTKSVLEQHILIHTGEKPYSCAVCNKTFRTKAMMKEHARIHGERNLFTCELCGKEYASRTNYKNHLNVHKGNRNFECEVCGKRFFAKYVMRKHMQIHTGTKNYQCEYCGKKFIQHGNWLIHRRSHTGEKPHGCAQCPAAFVNSSQLKAHEKRVHDQKKEFMCDKCYKHFYTRKGLQGHMRNIHQKKEKGQIYHCGKCDRLFALQENQQEHESSCTGLRKVLPCLRPSVLQTVLKKVYSHEARKVSKRLETEHVIDRPSEVVIELKRNLIQEPIQLIPEEAVDQYVPVPAPVQQFQVTSEAQEPLIHSDDVPRVVHILTPDLSDHCETVESYIELEDVPSEEGEESPKGISEESITDVQSLVKISSFIEKTASGAASHLNNGDTPPSQCDIDRGSQVVTSVTSSGDSVGTGSSTLSLLVKENYSESADLARIIETCKIGFDRCNKSSETQTEIKEESCSVRSPTGDCSGSYKNIQNIQKPILSVQAKTANQLETSKLQASSCYQSGAAMTHTNNGNSSENISCSSKFSSDTYFNNECKDSELQCRLCQMAFKSEIEAKKHLEAHSNKLFYQCSICSQRFSSTEFLTSHLLTHIFSCIIRKKTHVSNNVSSDVQAIQPTNILSSRNEYDISNLNREAIQLSNNVSSNRYESQNTITELSTSKCGAQHSHTATSTLSKTSPEVKKECCITKYSCQDCGREFSSKGLLKLHQVNLSCRRQFQSGVVTRGMYIYLHKKEPSMKLHQCPVCKKKFRSKSVFQIHKRTHENNSFQCNQCQKKFVLLENFRKHKICHCNARVWPRTVSSVISKQQQTQVSSAKAVSNQACVSGFQKISSEQPNFRVHPVSCYQQGSNVSDIKPSLTIQPGSDQHTQQIQPNSDNQQLSKCSNIQSVHSIQTSSKILTSQTDNSRPIVQLTSDQSTSFNQSTTQVQPTTGCQLASSCIQPVDHCKAKESERVLYSCSLCEETFPLQELLSAHHNTHVLPGVTFLCQICNLHFEEETQFTDHIKLHGDVVLEVGQKEEVLEVEEVSDASHMRHDMEVIKNQYNL